MAIELAEDRRFVTRINLKTGVQVPRQELIDFCLNNPKEQYLAIGWSCVYEDEKLKKPINNYEDFYYATVDWKNNYGGRLNHVFNVFWYVQKDDLFWTRDLDGCYWICRAKGPAETKYDHDLDIGAVVPVEAYKVGLEVPGQIKASFNQAHGGISGKIDKKNIVEYSKYAFNDRAGKEYYAVNKDNGDFIENLPDFELEELVLSYLQIEKNYYLLSNSIAQKSTTVKIEGALFSESVKGDKAVVQVKASGYTGTLYASSFKEYIDDGYLVYLYCPKFENDLKENKDKVIKIEKKELEDFVNKKGDLLPDNIMMWKDLFSTIPQKPEK